MRTRTMWEIAEQMDKDLHTIEQCKHGACDVPEGHDPEPSLEELDAIEVQEQLFQADILARLEKGETAAEIIASFGGWYARDVYEVEAEYKWSQVGSR